MHKLSGTTIMHMSTVGNLDWAIDHVKSLHPNTGDAAKMQNLVVMYLTAERDRCASLAVDSWNREADSEK